MSIGLNLLKLRLVAYHLTDTFYDSLFLPIVACRLPGPDEKCAPVAAPLATGHPGRIFEWIGLVGGLCDNQEDGAGGRGDAAAVDGYSEVVEGGGGRAQGATPTEGPGAEPVVPVLRR